MGSDQLDRHVSDLVGARAGGGERRVQAQHDKGKLTDAITRGDGAIGERILSNACRMKGVPGKLKNPVSVTVRGEIILAEPIANSIRSIDPHSEASLTAARASASAYTIAERIHGP